MSAFICWSLGHRFIWSIRWRNGLVREICDRCGEIQERQS